MEEIPMEEDLHGNCNLFEKIHVSVICSQFQILLQKNAIIRNAHPQRRLCLDFIHNSFNIFFASVHSGGSLSSAADSEHTSTKVCL